MKRIIYTLTLSAAMLAASTLVMAKSDKDNRPDDKRCEAQFEAAKEACESLSTRDAIQKCKAQVEEKAKQMCKEAGDDQDRDRDQDQR